MSDIYYEIYRNPSTPEGDAEAARLLHKHNPNIFNRHNFTIPVVEYLLRSLETDPTWPSAVKKWHTDITGWIPDKVFNWWQPQLDEHELAGMLREWWMYRALGVAVAWRGGKPVGAVSLTQVYWTDRGSHWPGYLLGRTPLFYEVRGLVVDPKFRRQGIGFRLIELIRDEAYRLGQLPTFAVTTSPSAAGIFSRTGASKTAPNLVGDALRELVCWCAPGTNPLCTHCPCRPRQIWWWPTHGTAADGS